MGRIEPWTLFLACLPWHSVAAQDVIYEVRPPAGALSISIVGAMGGVSGDGHTDLLVTDGIAYWMTSGRDGRLIGGPLLGTSTPIRRVLPIGDVDGDRVAEFVVVSDRVEVRTVQWRVVHSVVASDAALAGDQDGDGAVDIFAGLGVVSGRSGLLIRALPLLTFVAAIGDYDRDGAVDVFTSDPSGPGRIARLISGRTGQVLSVRDSLGAVFEAADHDQDGYQDVIVHSALVGMVFSVRRWTMLYLTGFMLLRSEPIAPIGDIDEDGFPDVIAPSSFGSAYSVVSLRTRATLYEIASGIGRRAAVGLNDVNGDGLPDFAVSGSDGGSPAVDVVRAHGRVRSTFRTFGVGCAGSVGIPDLDAARPPAVGESFDVSATPLLPFVGSYLALGFSASNWAGVPLPFELSGLGAPGCRIYVSGDALLPFVNNNGTASWSVRVPRDYNLLRTRFFVQCVALDFRANRLGVITSAAGEAVVGG